VKHKKRPADAGLFRLEEYENQNSMVY